MLPFSVRQTLLMWQGAWLGKKHKKVWEAALFVSLEDLAGEEHGGF